AGLEPGQWPWDRRLVVDLGAELSGVEAELIAQLSRAGIAIEVYAPARDTRERHPSSLWPYAQLLFEKIANKEAARAFSPEELAAFTPKRLTSPLAEVKAAVAEVRA